MRSPRALVALAVATTLAGCGAGGDDAPFGKGERDLLPDLVTAPIRDMYVETKEGRRRLRLTHEIDNVGRGPFELHPLSRPCGNPRQPRQPYSGQQWIYRDGDGNGRFDRNQDTETSKRMVTCLVFHRVHRHYHIDDFVRYEVLRPSGRGKPLRTSGKVSFCLVDGLRPRPDLPGSPPASYFQVADARPGDCEEGTLIGLSVGYGDVYKSELVDQWVDVTGLKPGDYCVRARTDVRGVVPESDERNNDRTARVHLSGGRAVKLLAGRCG